MQEHLPYPRLQGLARVLAADLRVLRVGRHTSTHLTHLKRSDQGLRPSLLYGGFCCH
jgi:hypothetical protein